MNYMDSEYYYIRNGQGDIIGLFDSTGAQVVTYTYDTWGKLTDIIGTMADSVGKANPYRYRGYRYDTETGLFYVGSRYYDPEVGRFINADTIDNTIENSDDLLSGNLFAYCTNNPVNHSDPDGTWKIPNWAKITIGAVALVGAVALTAATGGAMAPLLIGVAVSTLSGAAIGAATGGVKGAIDGAADGFMWGGIGALGSSAVGAVKAVKTAKKAVVIGEKMKDRVIPAAKQLNANYYKGLKGYKTIEKVAGKNIAEKLGMAHNKAWITRQMKLGTKILDIGSAGTNSANYAMERAVTSGYWNYSRVLGW
jgi:RHS repeat-associated protein